MAAKLNIINIMIYIWIFCLYILISKIIFGIFWLFINITYVFKDLKDYMISYNSPIMGPLAHGYDIITAGPMMIIWAGMFFIITVVILLLMVIWLIIKKIFFISFLANKSPFKELTPIFEVILKKVPFKPVFNKYNNELIEILQNANRELTSDLQDAMKKYKKRSFENFTNKKVIETFSSNKEYIEDDYYNDLKNYYKLKDNYYIGAYKTYKHSDEASLYKNYKIITPDMDDNEVSGVISENNIVSSRISSQSMVSKKFKI